MYVYFYYFLSVRSSVGLIQDRISEARPIFVCYKKVSSFFEIEFDKRVILKRPNPY